jgi:hypothetical protein
MEIRSTDADSAYLHAHLSRTGFQGRAVEEIEAMWG